MIQEKIAHALQEVDFNYSVFGLDLLRNICKSMNELGADIRTFTQTLFVILVLTQYPYETLGSDKGNYSLIFYSLIFSKCHYRRLTNTV